ncbi:hypothetical protein ACU5DF_23405 [Aliivibrio wodanis]|uniref:hypothetical protein n=1 Tax=Aliivibrio wodanis TaxID=80852 RepID=UPI00406C80C2
MTIYCGVRAGDGISEFYKATLMQNIKGIGPVTVVGYMSGETSIEMNQLWESPFEGDTAGNAGGKEKVAQVGQTLVGMTTKTSWNSKMVWGGAEALTFNIKLQFIAYSDAKIEVNDAIKYLMMMSSPSTGLTPLQAVPGAVKLNLGRRILTDVYIKSVSYNEAAPKTEDGFFTHNEIVLELSVDGALNASEVAVVFK